MIIILPKYPIDALEKSEWYEWYIEAGILSHSYSNGQIIAFNLSHVLIHPGFNKRVPPRYDHDIAIIKVRVKKWIYFFRYTAKMTLHAGNPLK